MDRDLVVVGGGPAGMAAAISAHRSGVKDILILERDQYLGGLLNQCIHTGFGLEYFKEILTGPEYADRFIRRIREIPDIKVSTRSFVVRLGRDRKLTYLKPGGIFTVRPKALIMATGCRERTREMLHIPGARPAGIFSAGLAQKLINIEGLLPGMEVVIVGSGDIGLIMARRFTLEGAKVKAIIEIQGRVSGLARNTVQCVEDFDIPVYLNHKVLKISGRDRVSGVTVAKVGRDLAVIPGTEFDIGCDTVLLSVGLIPENELIEMAGAAIDRRTNRPISKDPNKTSIPGIFVCGNAFKVYDYVDSVTKDSESAGKSAARYIGRR
ncbi:MAG: FAD-dependent oxidoreductase [Candidatus Omnitrophota bacterium]